MNSRIFPFHPVFVLPVLVELIEFFLFHLVFFFPDLSVLIEFVRLVVKGRARTDPTRNPVGQSWVVTISFSKLRLGWEELRTYGNE